MNPRRDSRVAAPAALLLVACGASSSLDRVEPEDASAGGAACAANGDAAGLADAADDGGAGVDATSTEASAEEGGGPAPDGASAADAGSTEDGSPGDIEPCGPGAVACVYDQLSRLLGVRSCLSNGVWGAITPCPYGCSNGACSGDCAPNTSRCLNSDLLQVCQSDGTWERGDNLGNDGECYDGACIGEYCRGGACRPGSRACVSDTQIADCRDDGTYADAVTCPGNVCSNGGCPGECTPGTTSCVGTAQVRVCRDDGSWEQPTICGNRACYQGACTGECAPNDTGCSGNLGQICGPDGTWTTTNTCDPVKQLCRDGQCFYIGYTTIGNQAPLLGAMDVDLTPGVLYLVPVMAGAAGSAYGVECPVRQSGIHGRAAIYSDANGAPGALLGASDDALINFYYPTVALRAGVDIVPGHAYWIGVAFSSAYATPETYEASVSGMVAYALPVDDTAPFPAIFPLAQSQIEAGMVLEFAVDVTETQ